MEAHKWANLATAAEMQKIADQALETRTQLEGFLSSSEIFRAQEEAASWEPGSLTPPLPPRKPRLFPIVSVDLAD